MTLTLRRDSRREVNVYLQATPHHAAIDLLVKKLGPTGYRVLPAEGLDAAGLDADTLIVFRQRESDRSPLNPADVPDDTATPRQLFRLLDLRTPRLPDGGYQIKFLRRGSLRLLILVGGDRFGMFAGLADLLNRSRLTPEGLTYTGHERTERPAIPLRYYWTWDLSTNWMLDDPGVQVFGCFHRYEKRPETFLEDYRRLIDHCLDTRFNGLVVWGFLRDAHGGEVYASEIAQYAADRGVSLLPGVGTTDYGGVYYEGRHPCNIETFLANHPQLGSLDHQGRRSHVRLSPYHHRAQQWIEQSLEWLYRTFPVAGVNLENGDLHVDHSPVARRARAKLRSREADFFKDQYFAYLTALRTVDRLAPHKWNTYATYSGFGRGQRIDNQGPDMGHDPYFSKRMPPSAIAQWTLTGMLRATPVPLRHWLTTPKPKLLYDNPNWPRGLRPPTPRSAGYVHHGSGYHHAVRRNSSFLSTAAEACLRAHEAGLEGITFYGEVTSRTLAWALNYLVMRHWTYHPASTFEDFAAVELAPRLGGDKPAQDFLECLCLLDEKKPAEAFELAKPYKLSTIPLHASDQGDVKLARQWQQVNEWARLQQNPSWADGFTDML